MQASHTDPACIGLQSVSAPEFGHAESCQRQDRPLNGTDISSSGVAGLTLKWSTLETKNCFQKAVFSFGSLLLCNNIYQTPLGLRLECHYGRWLWEKGEKKLFFSTMSRCCHPWNARLSLMHKSLLPQSISLCLFFSLKGCCASSVLIRECTVVCSNGSWHSMSLYSHLVKSSVILFFSGYCTPSSCILECNQI